MGVPGLAKLGVENVGREIDRRCYLWDGVEVKNEFYDYSNVFNYPLIEEESGSFQKQLEKYFKPGTEKGK